MSVNISTKINLFGKPLKLHYSRPVVSKNSSIRRGMATAKDALPKKHQLMVSTVSKLFSVSESSCCYGPIFLVSTISHSLEKSPK